MPRSSRIGTLKLFNPSEWKEEVRKAMKASGGRIPDAARFLKISERQLFRWLALDEMKEIPRSPTGVHREEEAPIEYPSRSKRKVS